MNRSTESGVQILTAISLFLAILVLRGSFVLRAQTPSPPTFRSGVNLVLVDAVVPTFHSSVNLVVVDVVVRDKKTGKLVTNLTSGDFKIDDSGKPQRVSTFTLIDLPKTRHINKLRIKSSPPRSNRTVTNGSEGRFIVFLIDDEEFAFDDTGYMRDLLHRYVDGHMADDDEVAIWTVSDFLPRQGFTTDRDRLDDIIDQFKGNRDVYNKQPWPALSTLDEIATALGNINGRRKVIVYLGLLNTRVIGTPLYEDALRAAAAANVAIYPVSPTGVTGNLYLPLNILADETGGRVFDRNDFDYTLDRIEEEAGTYYLLGFTPTDVDAQSGRLRRIHVTVDRPDVSVQVRMRYSQLPKEHIPQPKTASIRDIIESVLPTTALRLRAGAASFAGPKDRDEIVVTMSADEPSARLGGHLLRYAVTGLDQHGEIVASDDGASQIPDADVLPRITVVSTLPLKPGLRTIKAALQSDDGLVGSVFVTVDAPKLTSGELTLSDVEMASPAERSLVLGKPPAFLTSRLPHPPTTTRDFPSGGTFEIYGEVYGSRKARTISARATVRTAGGDIKRRLDLNLEPIAPLDGSNRQRFRYERAIDLYGLADGDYTLEIDASDQTGHSATARESFSIGGNAGSGGHGH